MKYIILSKGCPFGDYDTIWGYVESKESAIFLCDYWNKEDEEEGNFYFEEVDENSPMYSCKLNLEYYVDFFQKKR